jgi:hypothetical protein
MTRLPVRLTLASLLVSLAPAGSALADTPLPDPTNSTVPACITLVGSNGGVPASIGEFLVVIRDLAGNPVPGASVTVDLSLVTDMRLCDDQLDPGVTLNCARRTVTAVTDLAGRALFTLVGGGNPTGARTFANAARVYWNGFLIASPSVSTFDADGDAGVGANDLSQWLADFGAGLPYARGDHDCSGDLGANDLSIWLGAFGAGTQTASCAASCP